MAEVCDTMDKKIEVAMEKHNVAMNHNLTAIKKTLDKLSERQDAADEDRKTLAKRQLRQDKMVMSMFKGMQKFFLENFDEEEFDDDAHGENGETINVDAMDQNDSTKGEGATKKPVTKIFWRQKDYHNENSCRARAVPIAQ